MDDVDVLIVGAGISGLLCATELKKSGLAVRVLDKGRGVGGRMATRQIGEARFDHGAQFFTVRKPIFQHYVDEWLQAGVIKEWFRKAPYDSNSEGYPRYCGIHGMTDAPKHLASTLDVHCSETVVGLKFNGKYWQVHCESKAVHRAQHLIITAPLPQALKLLDTSSLESAGDSLEPLRSIRYQRGLATLAVLENPSDLKGAGFLKPEDSKLTWIADNQMKGISEVPCVTIHSTAQFAEEHWDSANEVRGPLMLKAAASYIESKVTTYQCHRWGFALSEATSDALFFQHPKYPLMLAGDAFSGGRVEGAALSGIAASAALKGLIQ